MKYDVYDIFFIVFLGIAALSLLVGIFSKDKKPLGSAVISFLAALVVWSMATI